MIHMLRAPGCRRVFRRPRSSQAGTDAEHSVRALAYHLSVAIVCGDLRSKGPNEPFASPFIGPQLDGVEEGAVRRYRSADREGFDLPGSVQG